MKAIRVVFVGQSGSEAGGAERSLQLLLSNLPERVRPTVLLFGDGAYASELRERGLTVEILALTKDVLTVQREKLSLGTALGAVTALPRLMATLRRLAPDVVYTNTVKAHVLGGVASRLVGLPAVSHYRDILEGPAAILLRTIAFSCTKRRIAISHAVARAIGVTGTIVVPNPLDLSQYDNLVSSGAARVELGLPQGVPLVGIVGRINRWKGHDRFLRIAKIVSESSDTHFVIVGKAMFRDADFGDELTELARQLGIADRVHNVPWLSDPRTAYAALDVNCNTSRSEPFGRTIIEAAACGVPTVVFNEGGAPEAIDDGVSGRIVATNDEAAFARAILALLGGSKDEIAAQARRHALRFDAGLHANRVADILDLVVAG